MTGTAPTTFGVLGAGRVGSNFARLAADHGYRVLLANSRDPATLAALAAELGPRVSATTPEIASADADILLLATPFRALDALPAAAMRGRIAIDATTYYPERDGVIDALTGDAGMTPGEYVQSRLVDVRIVRALTHVSAADLPRDGLPAGEPNRRALALTGDDPQAKHVVAGVFDELGYDSVDFGALKESWRYDPFTAVSGVRLTADELSALVRAERRA